MKKYKNIFGIICGFATGTIISALTATYAATTLSSKNVYYDNSTSGGSSSNVSGAIDELYATADDHDILKSEIKSEIIDTIYPKGSIYISTTDSSVDAVEAKFGGEWEKYSEGKTLVGEGTNTDSEDNSKTFTISENDSKTGIYKAELNIANLPAHSHNVTASGTVSSTFTGTEVTSGNQSANHTHSIPALSGSASGGAHTHTAYIKTKTDMLAKGTVFSQMASDGTDVSGVVSIPSSGAHTHTITTVQNTTGSNSANHNHKVTAAGTVSSTFTGTKVTSTSTGSGKAVNVQNPYTVVYMYRRVN